MNQYEFIYNFKHYICHEKVFIFNLSNDIINIIRIRYLIHL